MKQLKDSLGIVRKEDAKTTAWRVQFTCTGQVLDYSNVPFQKTRRDSPVFHHALEQSVALANFVCKQVLVGKFTLQALNTQCLGWQHFFGNKSDLQCVFLTELVHDCCPAQTTSKLNYSSILKCQTCIKVPCFEEPMRVEKVSLEMSLNCIFNLFALCGKYFWLY